MIVISEFDCIFLKDFQVASVSYRVFNGFGQAKFPDGGLVLGSSQFFNIAPAAYKNTAHFKSGQN